MTWVRIEDSTPKDGETVDVWIKHKGGRGARLVNVCYHHNEKGSYVTNAFFPHIPLFERHEEYKVTHWMPEPTPPTEEE